MNDSIDWSELSLQIMISFAHFMWQGCVVAILLLLAEQLSAIASRSIPAPDRLLRSARTAKARYTIACLAFFTLPVCVATTFLWVHDSRGPVLHAVKSIDDTQFVSPAMATEFKPSAMPSAVMIETPAPRREPPQPLSGYARAISASPKEMTVGKPWNERVQWLAPYLLLAYMLGVAVMLARFGKSIFNCTKLRHELESITDHAVLRVISEQSARLGLNRLPSVALCQRINVPVVVGLLKPAILLPPALLCGLDPNQLAAILCHEMAHIRRYDLLVNLLQRVVEALLFFHPVTWWISRRVSAERENCCDDMAAACTGRLPYASALLQMAELCIGNDRKRLATLASLSAGGSNASDFGDRIRRLIGEEQSARIGISRRGVLTGLGIVSVLMLSLMAESKVVVQVADQLPKTISGHVEADLAEVQVTARLELEQQDANDSSNPTYRLVHTASTKTDAKGNFSIEVPKEQLGDAALVVSLRYELTGYLQRTIERVYVDDLQFPDRSYEEPTRLNRQANCQWVRQTRLKTARPFKGRVLLANDSPAVGAIVVTDSKYRPYAWKFSLGGDDYPASSFTTTDANGDFELQTDDSATLVIQLAGHAPLIIDDLYGGIPLVSLVKSDPPGTFRLPMGIRPSGVVKTYDGKPIAGAILSVTRSFKWDEFNMPLSFALSVAANERGEFELPPLPEDRYKISVTSKIEDISRVDDYNRTTSQHSWVAMRAMLMNEGNELHLQKPIPNTVLIRDVLPEQEWELTAAVQSPKFDLESIEAVIVSVRIIDQTGIVREKRAVDATIHGVFAGKPWYGISRKAEADGFARLTAPKGVSNLVIGTGHAHHRRSPNEEIQLGDAIHLGSVDNNVEGPEVIQPQLATLNVSIKFPPEMEQAASSGKEPIHFQTYYVRDGFLENSPSLSRMYLARSVQTNNSQYQAMALPNEEFVLKITKGIPSGQTDLYEARFTLKPGQVLNRTIDLTKAATPKEEMGVVPAGIQWGKLVDGLRLGIRPQATARRSVRLRHGDRMEYEVWIKNETTSAVHIKLPRSEVFGPAVVDRRIDLLEHKVTIFSETDIAGVTINPGDARLCETSVTTLCVEDPKMIYPMQIGLGKHTVYAAKRYDYLLGGYADEARSDTRQVELRSGEQQIEVLPAARLVIKEAREFTGTHDAADPSAQLWDWQTTAGKNLKVFHLRYGEVLVDEDDILFAQAIPAAWDPSFYSIELTLKPQTDTALVTATKEMSLRVNDRPLLAILFDGKLLSALKIDAPIADHKLTLTGRFNRQQAEETAKLLTTIRQVNLPLPQSENKQKEAEDADAKQLVTFDTDPISICQEWIKSWDRDGKNVLACKARERLANRLAIISKQAVESFTRPAPKSDANLDSDGDRVDVQVALDGHWSTGIGNAAGWQDWITRKQGEYSRLRMQMLFEAGQGFRKQGNFVAAGRVLQSGLAGNSIYDMPLAELIADHWPVKSGEPAAIFGTGHFGGPYAAPHAWTLINYLNELAQVQKELGDVEHAKEAQSRHMLACFMMSWDQPAGAPTQSAGQLWNLLRENPQTLPPLFWFNVLKPSSASIKLDFTDAVTPKSPLRFHGENVVAAPIYDFDQLTITAEFHSKSGIIDVYTVPQIGKQGMSLGVLQPKSDGAADQSITQKINVPAGTGLIQFRLGGEDVQIGLVNVEATFKKREGFATTEKGDAAKRLNLPRPDQPIQDGNSGKAVIAERDILGQWEAGPNETGARSLPMSIIIKFSADGKFDRYGEWPNQVEYATGSWQLEGKQVQVKYKAITPQPSDNKETEGTLEFESPETLLLGKVRFQRRMGMAAKAVKIDAKHPLHELSKELLAKLNAGTSAEPSAAWHVLQFYDTPAIKLVAAASGFDASKATSYRLLLARDYQEFANTMQQRVELPFARPFRLCTEHLEIVLFASQPQMPPAELASRIEWLGAKAQWPTHVMCLGEGQGYTWFVRAPLQICHSMRNEWKLTGGDDMVATLVQATIFKKGFPPDADVHTASAILGNYGDRTVTAVEQAVRQAKPQDDLWHTIRSLAAIRSDASNKLLLQLFQSTNNDLHKAAAYALISKPYRRELASVYVDMLKNREGVEEASAACVEFGLKDAIPHLKVLVSKPSSVRELNTTFKAQRTLEGNPIPKELLDASEIIFQYRKVDPVDEGSVVGNAIKQFMEMTDHEAVVVMALQMVNYTNKADVNHIRAIGSTILKAQKSAASVLFMKTVLDSLPERERDEVLQKINPLANNVPATGLTPIRPASQPQSPPAVKPIPSGPK